jgi:hypothetical protein
MAGIKTVGSTLDYFETREMMDLMDNANTPEEHKRLDYLLSRNISVERIPYNPNPSGNSSIRVIHYGEEEEEDIWGAMIK